MFEPNRVLERLCDESGEDYRARLPFLLPYFPIAVLEDWLCRHGNAVSLFGWLDYRQFRFSREEWQSVQVESVMSSNEPTVEGWSQLFRESQCRRKNRLGAFMINEGTWPVPPIVLDNTNGICSPAGQQLSRYHLLEGHHRLAYLRGLIADPRWEVEPSHEIWLVTYNQDC
ncbi:MAG TPA: hypothetical protein VIE43_17865 [Thermoanaerobaculia bacterium]|nr:hypothetical protein [Thermoanaerobaculia bacterium]